MIFILIIAKNFLAFIGTASSEDESKGPRKKQKKGGSISSAAVVGAAGSGSQADTSALAHPADVLDMPVDPNEPTYCVCNQVSYGEMIGCDNPDVSILLSFESIDIYFIRF